METRLTMGSLRGRDGPASRCLGNLGFSLVEIALTIAILATVLVITIALLSPGLEAGMQSASQTITGAILEDVHERMEGEPLAEGAVAGGPYFYDDQGIFIAASAAPEVLARRIYRAEARIVRPSEANVPANTTGLMGVIVDLYWPVHSASGEIFADAKPGTSITYYLTTLAGPDWMRIDPSFVPKIEF